MADSNDDLLEDGDLSETNFEELDLAEEDALLADDCDEKPIKSTHDEGDKTTMEDDDYLELGVDEDLTLNDEEVVENGGGEKKRIPIHLGDFSTHDNDDSDENSGGERTRFKSERQITTSLTRNSTTIPETLDAVALRNPVKFNKGGNRGGKGGRIGGNRKFGKNQPTNIHVNPHFRPRVPIGGQQMWNGGFQGPPQQHFQPPHAPPYGYQQPPMQQPQWNDQSGGYFMPPGPPSFHPPMDNNYYGPGPHQDNYYSQPMQHNYPQGGPPPQHQMGWGDPNYYHGGGPPQNFPPPHFQAGPGPQMGPTRMRPPFNAGPRPPFIKHPNKQVNVRHHLQGNQQGWSGGPRPQKRDQFHHSGKTPPVKQQRFENSSVHRVRSNLQEVKMVDHVPVDTAVTEEEDEETKAYRKKIEEQKRLREQLLKEKEEKRLIAAQQKLRESGATVAVPTIQPPSNDRPPGTAGDNKQVQYKTVRVRTADGKTIVKKMTLEEIKKLKKVSPATTKTTNPTNSSGTPSRLVSVENLSASTTQRQLEEMAGQIGPVELVELDCERKTAIIKFTQLESAVDFVSKFQRKMVDLSMIGVKFIKQD